MVEDTFAALPPGAEPTRTQIQQVIAIRRTATDSLAGIEPPETFIVEHAALVAALENLTTSGEQFLESTAELGPDEFLGALLASTDIDVLADTVAAVCRIWEARAADSGSPTDLGC